MRTTTRTTTALTAVGLLMSTIAWAQPVRDHLQCFKIKDTRPKTIYTADLSPDNPALPAVEAGCQIKVPAVQLCVDVATSNVAPVPPGSPAGTPAQTYICYKTKCEKLVAAVGANDEFGTHSLTLKATSMVCAPVAPSCSDGVRNGSETGPDCGGGCPTLCADGLGCAIGGDCQSGYCAAGTCGPPPVPNCLDGLQNGDETGKDCGGSCVALGQKCPTGFGCLSANDCTSGVCTANVCSPGSIPSHCSDSVLDADETGKDCGGSCASFGQTCSNGFGCASGGDCQSGVCTANVCTPPPPPPYCVDGVKDVDETDKDCGGSCTAAGLYCPNGLGCASGGDCQSGFCNAGVCSAIVFIPPGCGNGYQSGDETGIDCGGICATAGLVCPNGSGCVSSGDCQSGFCNGFVCSDPIPPHCLNGVQDGDETGLNCGGSCTSYGFPCSNGSGCASNGDCASNICTANVCMAPVGPPAHCMNGVQDADETGKDCGNSCAPFGLKCPVGAGCGSSGDCLSGSCVVGVCQP